MPLTYVEVTDPTKAKENIFYELYATCKGPGGVTYLWDKTRLQLKPPENNTIARLKTDLPPAGKFGVTVRTMTEHNTFAVIINELTKGSPTVGIEVGTIIHGLTYRQIGRKDDVLAEIRRTHLKNPSGRERFPSADFNFTPPPGVDSYPPGKIYDVKLTSTGGDTFKVEITREKGTISVQVGTIKARN